MSVLLGKVARSVSYVGVAGLLVRGPAGGAQKRKLRSSDAVAGEEEEVKGIKVKEVEEVKKVKDVKDVNKVKEEAGPSYWLFKSEPDPRMEGGVDVSFSFEALRREPAGTACWDGVRNYSARNHMRAMKVGQKAFFYHSNTKPPGIIGLVEVVREAYTDHTQFDSKDPHYDSKSKEEEPKWSMVDVKYTRPTRRYITLEELKALHLQHKARGGPLAGLAMFTKARLSVQPLTGEEWDFILALEDQEA